MMSGGAGSSAKNWSVFRNETGCSRCEEHSQCLHSLLPGSIHKHPGRWNKMYHNLKPLLVFSEHKIFLSLVSFGNNLVIYMRPSVKNNWDRLEEVKGWQCGCMARGEGNLLWFSCPLQFPDYNANSLINDLLLNWATVTRTGNKESICCITIFIYCNLINKTRLLWAIMWNT